jgi:hypothetical protein
MACAIVTTSDKACGPLKKSHAEIALKNRDVRMPYKRSSLVDHAFWCAFQKNQLLQQPTPDCDSHIILARRLRSDGRAQGGL